LALDAGDGVIPAQNGDVRLKELRCRRGEHADLQNKGVRCWFAPHDLPIGAKILDGIDEAIRLRDKVLLILSEHSIKSDWVEDEVTTAFEEERPLFLVVRLRTREGRHSQ
jgi:TIR domain